MTFFVWILFAVGSILLTVLLPGLFLCCLTGARAKWSTIDAFFMGWVCFFSVSAFMSPWLETSASIAISTRIILALFCFGVLIVLFTKKRQKDLLHYFDPRQRYRGWSSFYSLGFGLLLSLIVVGYLVGHNTGFDDSAHLEYLSRILKDHVFLPDKKITDGWYAARYPYFGLLIGTLAFGIPGGVVFVYYFAGISIFVIFILKIYELIFDLTKNQANALLLVIAAVAILVTQGNDNYLNFCIYPLEMGKLFFMSGLLYLIKGWNRKEITHHFWVGSGLVTMGALIHLNLLITYFFSIPLLVIVFFCFSKGGHNKIKVLCLIVCFPILALPSGLHISNGFLHYGSPISSKKVYEKIEGKVERVERVESTRLKVGRMMKLPAKWTRQGSRKMYYIHRAWIPEFFWLAGLVFLIPHLFFFSRIYLIIGCIALIVILHNFITIVPKQLSVALYRRGTAVMLYDSLRSKIKWNKNITYWTDSYTALYLELLYNVSAKKLTLVEETLAFSPLYNFGRDVLPDRFSKNVQLEDYIVFNGRFWGQEATQIWTNKKTTSMDVSDRIKQLNRGNLFAGLELAKYFIKMLKEQTQLPILVVSPDTILKSRAADQTVEPIEFEKELVDTFKDIAIVKVFRVKKGEQFRIGFKYYGDDVHLINQKLLPGEIPFSVLSYDRDAGFLLEAKQDCDRAVFLFWAEFEQRMGIVQSVSIDFL
jgi:hypothetical protein